MVSNTKQIGVLWMLSVGSAVMLCAQQRVTPSEAARMQRQFSKEMRELQTQMDNSLRENKHVVREAAVVEIEARKEREAKRDNKAVVQKTNVNPRSPEEKAKVAALIKEVNAKLPEMNASLNQTLSHSKLPQIEMKPLNADEVLSAVGGNSSPVKPAEQQVIQAIQQRLQDAMKKMDPQAHNQLNAVLKASEQGKTMPLARNLPPQTQSQLLPKGAP